MTISERKEAMTTETPKTSEFDWNRFKEWEAERRRKMEENIRNERAELLALLRNAKITGIEANYDGYADSGNVSELSATPESVEVGELDSRLRDFTWDIASMLHPGFEIDDGGEGTLTWDVTEDRIDLDHADFFSERIPYLHEDI